MVGLIPLFAVEVLERRRDRPAARLPASGCDWFLDNRHDLARHISYMEPRDGDGHGHRLLAIPSRERLERVLRYVLDENEFLSPYGIRSLSRVHEEQPYVLRRRRRGVPRRLRAGRIDHAACSAATRTGAGPSGSRSTTC